MRSFLIEWERHHEDMQRLPDHGDHSIGLTEVDLRRPGRPNQLSEPLASLPVPDIPLPDEALHRRIGPREDVLEHEAVKDPLRGVALLPRPTLVLHQPLLEDLLEPGQHRPTRPGRRGWSCR
jgi:hypothetical protein